MQPLNRILLVDDDPVSTLTYRRMIERNGLARAIEEARDGVEALERLGSAESGQAPDLILLDVMMPRLNGLDFLDRFAALRESLQPRPAIVVVSTTSNAAQRARAFAHPDVRGYLAKPLCLQELAGAILSCRDWAGAGGTATDGAGLKSG